MKEVVLEILNHIGLGENAMIEGANAYCNKLNDLTNNMFGFEVADGLYPTDANGEPLHGFVMSFKTNDSTHTMVVETRASGSISHIKIK